LLTQLWSSGSVEAVAKGVLGAEFIWDENLNNIPGLTDKLIGYLDSVQKNGMLNTVKSIL